MMSDPEDYVTIADAAEKLGVSRNDMHCIPVKRRRIWQTQVYLWGDIMKWQAQDIQSSKSLLQRLRKKKEAVALKKGKRAYPYTKTGKRKQRFRQKRCPDCGAGLIEEKEDADWYSPDDLDDTDDLLCRPEEIAGGIRSIPVRVKGQRRPARIVTLDFDSEKKKAEALQQAKSEPRKLTLQRTFLRCPKCGFFRVLGVPDDDDDFGYTEDDDSRRPGFGRDGIGRIHQTDALSDAIDDDVRAMTTSVLSKDGEVLGDLGDIDKDDGKS